MSKQPSSIGLVLDPEALYVALDAHRRKLQREGGGRISWRGVARDIGVSNSTFSRVGVIGGNINANSLIKLMLWMGQTDLQPYIRTVAPSPNHWSA